MDRFIQLSNGDLLNINHITAVIKDNVWRVHMVDGKSWEVTPDDVDVISEWDIDPEDLD